MDDVSDLVITPFRDVVEKGRMAVANAGEDQVMLKAAQSLVKEGERALKNIQPLCKKYLDEYGSNFIDALKANNEIGDYRYQLTEQLWDFDDYIEIDEFNAEKFSELQTLSRKSAPKICDILRRMRIEPLPPGHNFMSQLSPPSSPLPSVAAPAPVARPHDSLSSGSTSEFRPMSEFETVNEATALLGQLVERHHSVDEEIPKAAQLAPEPEHRERSISMERPPQPPDINPWDTQTTHIPPEEIPMEDILSFERRQSVACAESSELSPTIPDRRYSVSRRPVGTAPPEHDIYEERRRSSSNSFSSSNSATIVPRQRAPTLPSTMSPTIPEEHSMREDDVASPTRVPFSPTDYEQQHSRHPSHDLYHGEVNDPVVVPDLPATNLPAHKNNSPILHQIRTSSLVDTASQPGLEVVPMAYTEGMDGLIPVETEKVSSPPVHISSRECSIGGGSSFYLNKGFCEGAKDVVKGGIGIKKTIKPGFTTATTVARCVSCLYELDFKLLENDVDRLPTANFSSNDIVYRIRFLQKSHVSAKRVDDVMFGCVFCVHMGRTMYESDATVFFTPKALFAHLARHPRPLPEVPGICVIDEAEVPQKLRNDFDLHLTKPPVPNPVYEKIDEIANLPTAVSKEVARRIYGQKLLQDRTPALELAPGSRITGLTWPAKYNGEWCFGWHDGIYATVPTEILNIDAPPTRDLKYGGTSQIRARARWRFAPKDKDKGDWLKFSKDEMITNISWPYPEHWCWSGTNSRGKWGIFPQAFMDTNTVQEPSSSGFDRAVSLNTERNKPSISMLSKFSIRRATGRPASIAESTGSR